MNLKKNIFYNVLLTISSVVIPVLIFPYVSRVLGASNLGIYSFVDEVVNYYVVLSALGIITLGIREIAKNKTNQEELNKSFSGIFFLHLIATVIILFIYFLSIFLVKDFYAHKTIFFIGATKILFNLFIIEWLFTGLENFKYITIRSVTIRILFLAAVFLFVKDKEDYGIYFLLTCIVVFFNALINWYYGRKIVTLKLKISYIKNFVKPYFTLGFYRILNNFYTTFNIIFLGFVAVKTSEVGYFSTAVKIEIIVLSIFIAYSSVLMPHVTKVLVSNNKKEFYNLLDNSIEILYSFSIPIIFIIIFLAPQIISVFSGPNYEGAILPLRIIILLLIISGFQNIFNNQIFLPMHKDKEIVFAAFFGAIASIILNFILVKNLQSVGSALVWVFSEFTVLLVSYFFVRENIHLYKIIKKFFVHLFYGIPYILIVLSAQRFFLNNWLVIIFSLGISLIYFLFVQNFILKNKHFFSILKNIF